MLRIIVLCFGAVLVLTHCAPLTFSNEAAVDFDLYRSVAIEMGGDDGSLRHARYLQQMLQQDSGFQRVTLDPEEQVDAVLFVDLTVVREVDIFDDEPDEFSANIGFELLTPDGVVLHENVVSGVDDADVFDAAEFSLDEVVSHYLPAYRI